MRIEFDDGTLLLRDAPDDVLTNRWNKYAVMLVKQALNGTASDSG
jgi:hypothetical protein